MMKFITIFALIGLVASSPFRVGVSNPSHPSFLAQTAFSFENLGESPLSSLHAVIIDPKDKSYFEASSLFNFFESSIPICLLQADNSTLQYALKVGKFPVNAFMGDGFYLLHKKGNSVVIRNSPTRSLVTKKIFSDGRIIEKDTLIFHSEQTVLNTGLSMLQEFLENPISLQSNLIPIGFVPGFMHANLASQQNILTATNSDMNEGKGITLHPFITYGIDIYAYKDINSYCSMITVHSGTTSPISADESIHVRPNGAFWFHTNTNIKNTCTNGIATVSRVAPGTVSQPPSGPVSVYLFEQLQMTINGAASAFSPTVDDSFLLPSWGVVTSNMATASYAGIHQIALYDASINTPQNFGDWWQQVYSGDNVVPPPQTSSNPLDWVVADLWLAKNSTAFFNANASAMVVGIFNPSGSSNGHHQIEWWNWASVFNYNVNFGALLP